MVSVLRNRALLLMAGAESVSTVGNWIAMQAIFALLIFQGGGGVGRSAGIYLSGLAPASLSTLVLMLIGLGTMLALPRAGVAGPVAANEVASGAE